MSGYFTELIFNVDGQEITFKLHELVRVAQTIVGEIKPAPTILPDYATYIAGLSNKVDAFLNTLCAQYEQHFHITGTSGLHNGVYIFIEHPFATMLSALYETNMSYFVASGLFMGPYMALLNAIKDKPKPRLTTAAFEESILLPLPNYLVCKRDRGGNR